jgi:hypothetical protein
LQGGVATHQSSVEPVSTALFRANADEVLNLGIAVTTGDLSGHLDVYALLIVAEDLGKR